MSKTDVEAVFGPEWVQRARAQAQYEARAAERIILALRHALRCINPTLPDIHNGTAWMPIEAEWMQNAQEQGEYLPPPASRTT